MLHEAAHALAARRGIKDTSAAGNRYHNKRVVALGAELGLRGPDVPDKVTGWSQCTLTGQAAYDFLRQHRRRDRHGPAPVPGRPARHSRARRRRRRRGRPGR